MSEREVVGFIVSPDLLGKLVGSGLDPQDLLRDVPDAVTDLDYHLRHGWPGMTTVRLARDVLAGRLDEEHAVDVVRALGPVLAAVGEPVHGDQAIWVLQTIGLEWGQILRTLGLATLANSGLWQESNLAWPWPHGTQPVHWPIHTELSASTLTQVAAEFDGLTATGQPRWRAAVAALPDDALGDPDWAEAIRDELGDILEQLAGWVNRAAEPSPSTRRCVAPKGNSLILIMDGDQ